MQLRLARHMPAVSEHFMIMLCTFTIIFCYGFAASADPDFWWHIKAGEFIAQTGTIPHLDQWTYTISGQPWIAHEWLSEWLMYILYSNFGFAAITLLYAVVSTAAFVLIYLLLHRLGVTGTLAMLLTIWARLLSPAPFHPRPLLFTSLFLAVFVFIIYQYREKHHAPLWLLPILTIIWVNLHAGYIAGLLLLGAVTVGEFLNKLSGRKAAPVLPLAISTIFSGLAVFVNPNGIDAILYPLSKAGGNASMKLITEWQPNNFYGWDAWPFAALLLAFMLLGTRRIDLTELLSVIAFTFLALLSVRNVMVLGFVVMPFLARRLSERGIFTIERPSRPKKVYAFAAIAAPIVLAATLLSIPAFQKGVEAGNSSYFAFPEGAVAYLKEHHPEGRLFNSYNWGGYLVYNLPEYPVFIDGRGDPFPDAVVKDMAAIYYVSPGWLDTLDRWDISIVLVEKDSHISAALDCVQQWRMVYEGPVERIYLRNI